MLLLVMQERNVTLLCYGTLLGGFLSDRYLGVEEPDPATFQSSSEEKVRGGRTLLHNRHRCIHGGLLGAASSQRTHLS